MVTTPAPSAEEAAAHKRLAAAISHPLRLQILDVLHRREASPRDIALEIGAKVGDVAYHVIRLRDVGAIELVRTEPTRGTLKHFYRAATEPIVTPLELDGEGYAEIVALLDHSLARARAIQAEVAARRADGGSPTDGLRSELIMLHIPRPPAQQP